MYSDHCQQKYFGYLRLHECMRVLFDWHFSLNLINNFLLRINDAGSYYSLLIIFNQILETYKLQVSYMIMSLVCLLCRLVHKHSMSFNTDTDHEEWHSTSCLHRAEIILLHTILFIPFIFSCNFSALYFKINPGIILKIIAKMI